jgi:hypothetical protein
MICCIQSVGATRMWIKIGLAVGVLAVAAAPEIFPVVSAAPEPVPAISKPAPRTFKPVCRGDEVLDSRPDPAWVSQSFNKDNCRAPLLPAALDGFSATREQVVAAMGEAKRYAVAADEFQRCVSDFVAVHRARSAPGPTLTPSQVIIENHRILVSQRSKERAAAQVRVAINAFNEYGSDCPDR